MRRRLSSWEDWNSEALETMAETGARCGEGTISVSSGIRMVRWRRVYTRRDSGGATSAALVSMNQA